MPNAPPFCPTPLPRPIAPSYCPNPAPTPIPTPNAQVHECSRAFSDRFNTAADKDFFVALLDEKLIKDFQVGVSVGARARP